MTCENCETYREKGAHFCPYCGDHLNGPRPAGAPRPRYGFIFIAGLVAAVQGMLIMFFEMLIGWSDTTTVIDGLGDRSYTLYYITPHIRDLVTIGPPGVSVLYITEMIIVTACFALMIILALKRVRDKHGDIRALEDTAAYEMPVALGIMLIVEIVYMALIRIGGTSTESGVSGSDVEMMFALLHASVYEEVLTRLLMIGLPCLIVALLLKRKDSPWWKYLFGGAKYERWMLIFVVFSATFFGLAHLDNWDTWKFFPTFLFGLICGYLFLKYGLYATIGAHFINDYLSASDWAWNAPAMFALGILAVGICSLPYVARYAVRGYNALKDLISEIKVRGSE